MTNRSGLSIADVVSGRCGARQQWAPYLKRLIEAGVVVDHERGLQWAALSQLFVRVLAKKARRARDHHKRDLDPFRPLMWPLLRAMHDTQYPHFILRLKDFVNSDIRERGKAISRVPATRPGRPIRGNACSSLMRSTTDWATRRADSGRLSAM